MLHRPRLSLRPGRVRAGGSHQGARHPQGRAQHRDGAHRRDRRHESAPRHHPSAAAGAFKGCNPDQRRTVSRHTRLRRKLRTGDKTMAMTGGDILVETLIDWGVDTIFGIPGDGINGVFEALRKREDKIRFVQTRHEEAAAYAACAYAKFTGRLGACVATSGPGGIHLLNGIYDAKLDCQPVIAITGAQHHDLIETHTQQDVALDKLFMDPAAYSVRVMGPAHVEDVVEQACRTALAYRQPTHVMIPVDFQSQPAKDRSERNVADHVSNVMARGGQLPDPEMLRRAA